MRSDIKVPGQKQQKMSL